MPFTDHNRFKTESKIFERANGVYYYTPDGREVFDGISGLWCVNAGHNQPKIVKAIQDQVGKMDFAPSFNTGHELGHKFAQKVLDLLPGRNFKEVFFTMCGSTAIDTSMKIALAYHRARGEGQRTRFIGRERGYHGVGFGGISIGGISPNRKAFSGALLPHVDHLPHTHSLKDMAFSRGQPTWGAHLADELERIVTLHDPSTIAAVFVEPVAGSTGVLPPPQGYLERLREICTKHGILLVFDEVITGFGRLGSSFGTVKFNVTPDMITCAKGLTNASVPAGAVICQGHVFDSIYNTAHSQPDVQIEFFHGYTYSAHPLAMAAGIATMEVFQEQKLFENANSLAPYWEELMFSMKDLPNVVDVRNIGLMGAVEFTTVPGAPLRRTMDIFDRAFKKGALVRVAGPAIAMSPPLVSNKEELAKLIDILTSAIKESAEHVK
jgi:beta-alanine--pyruvate transaminase